MDSFPVCTPVSARLTHLLTVGVADVLLLSGMSAMLGLLAFPSRGLPPSDGLDFLL